MKLFQEEVETDENLGNAHKISSDGKRRIVITYPLLVFEKAL